MKKVTVDKKLFQGFSAPNYTQVPDELFDELMVDLSGAELKVLLYIIRRTFGFKKIVDNISLNQMIYGITTKSGEVLDKGTGLSKKTLLITLKSLVLKNIITTERRQSIERGNEPTAYKLNLTSNNKTSEVVVEKDSPLGVKTTPSLGVKTTPRARGKNYTIQQTVLQETDIQYRNSNGKTPSNISKDIGSIGKFTTIGDLLKKKIAEKKREEKEIPEPIKSSIQEISREFRERNLQANITHAMRIYHQAGKSTERFTSYLYEARSITKQQGSVKKMMPYFFSVLENIVGIKNNPFVASNLTV